MTDQAEKLRQLVVAGRAKQGGAEHLLAREPAADGKTSDAPSQRATQSLLFTSGKGGVGTSNLVLNLAIALGEIGQRVVLIDADFGLANLDLLCGITPSHDLGDVLAGRCRLCAATVNGPGDIQIVPGAHSVRTSAEHLRDGPARLAGELGEMDMALDYVLIDAGSGLAQGIGTLAAVSDQVVVVSTPEPTSIADAQAAINRCVRLTTRPRLRVLVNQAASASEAAEVVGHLFASSRLFLGAVVSPLGTGSVRADPHVSMAVRNRLPFVTAYPGAIASQGVRRLARSLVRERHPPRRNRRVGLLSVLAPRWLMNLAASS
jgi:flagellar biosynthesis protein FlhG